MSHETTAVPTLIDTLNAVDLAMSHIEFMRDLFTAIKAMAPDAANLPFHGLAQQGQYWADIAHNDLDGFREVIETAREAAV